MEARIPSPESGGLERAAAVIKCLGHPLRLRLLKAREDGEPTVSDPTHLSGAPQAIVSQQLGILRGRGVVSATRRGAHVYYGINEPRIQHLLEVLRSDGGPPDPGRPSATS